VEKTAASLLLVEDTWRWKQHVFPRTWYMQYHMALYSRS